MSVVQEGLVYKFEELAQPEKPEEALGLSHEQIETILNQCMYTVLKQKG